MKRTLISFVLAGFLCAPAFAQDNTSDYKKYIIPVVSAELKTKIFKAEATANTAQLNLEHSKEFQANQAAQADWRVVIQEFVKVCGDNYTASLDDKGDPTCKEKPAPTPAPDPAKK